jgi:hypothetical protein
MQGLVDSVFRKRSIPALLLHEKCNEGVFGEKLTRHEVVDGVRRIDAIDAFAGGKYPLLEPSDVRLFLPSKLRQDPAPWGGSDSPTSHQNCATSLRPLLLMPMWSQERLNWRSAASLS